MHNLPLEYHDTNLAHFMGDMIGEYVSMDWQPTFPRNIRFLRLQVRIDPWLPLVVGFILKCDDGQYMWIECRYECIFKICKKCGLIGHSRNQCHMDIANVEDLLRDQAFRTRSHYPIEFALDITKVLFTDDIGAFRHHPSRRTTEVRYEVDSQSSPINLSNNQLPGTPQPLNNQHQTNLYQQPSNQPPQNNNQSHSGESNRNHSQSQRTSHGHLSFYRFMVRDLNDLEAHNPNSPTNDSLWETNYLADTDEEIDSSNAALNTTT